MTIPEKYMERDVIGLLEMITCKGKKNEVQVKARIDTGATKSSIDQALAEELQLGPILGEKTIKNAHGVAKRKIISMTIELAGKEITAEFTIADRAHMRYPVLIGRNILKSGFLIDPSKKLRVKS